MKKKNLIKGAGVLTIMATLAGCSCNQPTAKDYENWAIENGWIKGVDLESSATSQGKGVNMGAWTWNDALKQATLKEFLKGDRIQDENGNAKEYNYRSMYAISTAIPVNVNGKTEIKTTNTNVEFVFDPSNFQFYGMGENGTEKILEFAVNQNVSLNWWRQLNASDADYPSGFGTEADYYHSYGVQVNGKVTVLTVDSPEADILRVFNAYCPTIKQHAATWATFTTDAQKLQYAKLILQHGKAYYVAPESIVITAAYDSMSKSLYNYGTREQAIAAAKCMTYSTNYANYKFITEDFWATKLAAKNAALTADAANNYALVNAAYGDWTTRTVLTVDVDGVGKAGTVVTNTDGLEASQYKTQTNWARVFALETTNTCGMMSQQILTNFTPVNN